MPPHPVRLHCFAHAGAGVSSFQGWPAHLPAAVEALPHLLPGRDARRREPRVTDRAGLLRDLASWFAGPPRQPYALYGHSLGALVALALARAMRDAGLTGPALLAVGACPPPDTASDLSDACDEPDERLLPRLHAVGAVPDRAAPGGLWHRAVLPVLRDDLRLARALRAEACRAPEAEPLDVPVLAVAGEDDPLAGPDAVAGWRRWTRGPVTLRTVPGDHWFAHRAELPRLLGQACTQLPRT